MARKARQPKGSRSSRGESRAKKDLQFRTFDPITGQLDSPTIDRSQVVPEARRLPTIDQLVKLSDAELFKTLQLFGIEQPWEALRADTAAYIQRMTSYPPGSPQFATELRRLTGIDSDKPSRALLSTSRAVYREYQNSILVAQNPPNQEYIRVDEADDNECENCEQLAGYVGTMQQHASVGLPGAASCLGGNYCRCSLVPID